MMRILEAREGFVKIESEKEVKLSSFLKVYDADKNYVAQVTKVQKVNNIYFVYAKLLYLFNETFETYDGSLPKLDAKISKFESKKILQTFVYNEPVVAGKFVDDRENVIVDKSAFDKKTLICVDSANFAEVISSNLKQELSKYSKTFVIDMQGVIPSQKFVAGKDFRLPLNTESLEFLFQDCLNDATADSKNLIKEIFQELADYSREVKFLPFGALKTIVDDMVDNSHIFKLLVLKNKLNKFVDMGYFALTQDDAENLDKILAMKNAFIDLSKLDVIFQNRYLETIYNNLDDNTAVIVIASNNISKKNLKTVLTKQGIASTFVTHSRFKFINEIKSMFKNFIVESSFASKEVFKQFGVFLNVMTPTTYLMVGEATNYIPLIADLERLPEEIVIEVEKEIINDEVFNEIIDNEDVEVYDVTVEKDECTQAIDKKSEELIEKISADVEETPNPSISLFEDDEDNDEVEADIDADAEVNVGDEAELEDDTLEFATEIEEFDEEQEVIDEIDDELTEVIDFEVQDDVYHTEIDEFQTIEVSEDVYDMADEAEELELSKENTIEEVDKIEVLEEQEYHLSEEVASEQNLDVNEEVDLIEESAMDIIKMDEVGSEVLEETGVLIADDKAISEPELEVIQVNEEFSDTEEIGEIVELDESEILEDDIIVEFDDIEELETESGLEKEIIEDVDKVFTTLREDTLSENDLDLIDELNSENAGSETFEELAEIHGDDEGLDFAEPIEELNEENELDNIEVKEILETKKSSTPNVPVYDAEIPTEDTVLSDPIEQGDTVTHAKYGVGVVEKMIKYGNKTLFSINFDNIGRRLLDPTLTEIKKG